MNLLLTLGVAGAGKTTFVNKILKDHKPFQLICLDDIRLALGDIYNERTEPVVAMITDVMGRTFMERGLPIIVDSTCTSKYIAKKWCELVKEYNYTTSAYYLDTPFEVCCNRRLNTLNTNKITIEVLERQREQLNELLEDTSMFDYFHTIKYKGE
jgi:predicted kinase